MRVVRQAELDESFEPLFDAPYGDDGLIVPSWPTVMTQALQLWLTKTTAELQQRFGSRSIMSCYVVPLDTYSDMAHLIAAEQHTDVRHIAYFCGVLSHADAPTWTWQTRWCWTAH